MATDFSEEDADVETPKELTAKKDDFSRWFSQILLLAGIIDKRYDAKGCNVWLNYGYEMMLNIKRYWDIIFRESGIKEMYFPLLVPVKYCEKNPSWWDGFKSQAYLVRGSVEKSTEYMLRPTGEPAMYPMFSLWIRSKKDLPFRIYETVSSFRYETRHTRPLIRDREITVWHEIHTAHATKEEAEEEAEAHVKLYDMIWKKCCLAPLRVNKPRWEVFPGAVGAIEYYNIMPSGRVMENGSINKLGQAYSEKFDIKFKDSDGAEKCVWQVCTGNGARLLAAVIAVHGDNKGIVVPPEIAPIQAVVIPIYTEKTKKQVLKKSKEILEKMKTAGIRAEIDMDDEKTPGSKFYEWEIKGVPLRIEIGPREVKEKALSAVKRNDGKKLKIKESVLPKEISKILAEVQKSLLKKSGSGLKDAIKPAKSKDEIKALVENKKVAQVFWCGGGECWDEIKKIEDGIELFGTALESPKQAGRCAVCGKATKTVGYAARTY
jgi:prolyl-tRNA synthetase